MVITKKNPIQIAIWAASVCISIGVFAVFSFLDYSSHPDALPSSNELLGNLKVALIVGLTHGAVWLLAFRGLRFLVAELLKK